VLRGNRRASANNGRQAGNNNTISCGEHFYQSRPAWRRLAGVFWREQSSRCCCGRRLNLRSLLPSTGLLVLVLALALVAMEPVAMESRFAGQSPSARRLAHGHIDRLIGSAWTLCGHQSEVIGFPSASIGSAAVGRLQVGSSVGLLAASERIAQVLGCNS